MLITPAGHRPGPRFQVFNYSDQSYGDTHQTITRETKGPVSTHFKNWYFLGPWHGEDYPETPYNGRKNVSRRWNRC
jgi:hypothetical protein